jgi:uncharacterized protein YgiM (DUF1202 family)
MYINKNVRVAVGFPSDFFDGLTQPPLVIRVGEALEIVENEKSQRWPAFALVTNENGERGWVPERFLRREGEKNIAIREYDTTTLDPSKGHVLMVLEEDNESGWLWCRDESGKTGWFPIDSITPY